MSAYFSEIDVYGGAGNEFIEIAVPKGADVSGYSFYAYDSSGNVAVGPVGLGTPTATIAGTDVYVLDDLAVISDISANEAILLQDDLGTTVQFVSFTNTITAVDGPAVGETSVNIGNSGSSSSMQSDDGGATYFVQSTQNAGTIPCYAPGSLIETPDGPRPVQILRPGDQIVDINGQAQEVLWTHAQRYDLRDSPVPAQPIRIAANALGPNQPHKDLLISLQHRILVGPGGCFDGHFSVTAFTPAVSLLGYPGVTKLQHQSFITWYHFACASHHVVRANGVASESMYLGPMFLNGLRPAFRYALRMLFDNHDVASGALNGPLCHSVLKPSEVRQALSLADKKLA